jgi:hypothetical protein
MFGFQMNAGYDNLVLMMALTMKAEFGKVSLHGAPLWNRQTSAGKEGDKGGILAPSMFGELKSLHRTI